MGASRVIVTFELSGGFGGLFSKSPLVHVIHLGELEEPAKSELLQLLDAIDLRALSSGSTAAAAATPAPAGGFDYRITVEQDGERHRIVCTDSSAPPALRPLLGFLQRAAFQARKAAAP